MAFLPSSRPRKLARANAAVAQLTIPPAAWKTCPWEPRAPIELGLRQWLRCAGAAMIDDQTIGMPSRAADELWHGLILCTGRYARFCEAAYGQFLHHRPEGDVAPGEAAAARAAETAGTMAEQLARTVAAWELVREPGEACVLWDLDTQLGLDEPWGLDAGTVAAVTAALKA